MVVYLGFRLAVDALKPDPHWLFGLSAIQVACALGLLYVARELFQLGKKRVDG
jgi:hypothetical protein